MVQLQCFFLKDLPNAVKPFKLFFMTLLIFLLPWQPILKNLFTLKGPPG